MQRLLMWFLLDAPLVLCLLSFSTLCCCSALLNLLGSNLRGFSNKAPSVHLPVAWNNTWVPSDVWDMGHSIQGSGEDVSCLAKTLDLWCWNLSAFMDHRWKDSLVLSSNTLPTLNVPLHSHFFSFRPILHAASVGRQEYSKVTVVQFRLTKPPTLFDMFSRSSLDIGDLLGDRFWLSPKKGKRYVDWCLHCFYVTKRCGHTSLADDKPSDNGKLVHGSCMMCPIMHAISHRRWLHLLTITG